MTNQLDLFKETESTLEIIEENIPDNNSGFDCDKLMLGLELLNKMAEDSNNLLQSMIDDIQKDWSEEDKLKINNPIEYDRLQKLKKPINTEPMAKELSTEAIETLKNSTVEGNIVKLPTGQLDRKVYTEVKNKLELIGGKWKGGNTSGFVFQENPADLLEQISNGENRNLKKEFQFFATPDTLANELVRIADIQPTEEPPLILEPSAGQGAIVKAINRRTGGCDVHCYEAMPVNQTILKKIPTVIFLGEDFLAHNGKLFDYIIANPPFSKNQDIDHVMKMWECLKPGGRIVSITSKHWQSSSNKKETNFRNWLNSVGANIQEINRGEFKDSGTMVGGLILIIDKV